MGRNGQLRASVEKSYINSPIPKLPSARFELGFNKALVQNEEVEEKCHW